MTPRAKVSKKPKDKTGEGRAPSPALLSRPAQDLAAVSQLVPAPYNPRIMDDESMLGLVRSIQEFGDIGGITWNKRTGHLVAGHQRFASLKKLYGAKLQVEEVAGEKFLVAPAIPDPVNEGKVLPAQRFHVTVVDFSEAKEKAANVTANNPHTQGWFLRGELQTILGQIDTYAGFRDLRLDELRLDFSEAEGLGLDPKEDAFSENNLTRLALADDGESGPKPLYPSTNELGIPDLKLALQADKICPPLMQWTGGKRKVRPGILHFYAPDERLESLWNKPKAPLRMEPLSICEVNWSMSEQEPRILAMWSIYQKRWLARHWQRWGFKIFVDLCTNFEFDDIALLGVPKGWKAYSMRLYGRGVATDVLDAKIETARERAGTKDILMFAMGGGHEAQNECQKRGLVWFPETREARFDSDPAEEGEESSEDSAESSD